MLAEGEAEEVIRQAVEKAKAGNEACLRMLLDRLWPPRKGQPVQLDMAPLKTAKDLMNAMTSLWSAIAEGRLTPDEGSALSLVAERSMQVLNQHELIKRIEALEEEQQLRNAEANFKSD
jgi:hypothetical protein